MRLSNNTITSKCVEVSKCFATQRGSYQLDLENTIRIGNIARLAANIRQSEFLNEKQIGIFALAMKQDPYAAKSDYLNVLDQLDWIDMEKDGKKIQIEERIPPINEILTTLGIFWEESEPSDIDQATLSCLTLLKDKPLLKDTLESEIFSEYDIDDKELEKTFDYGIEANYLGNFRSYETNQNVVYTPYYWNRNAKKVLNFLKRNYSDDFQGVSDLNTIIAKKPGIPIENEKIFNNPILTAGIESGFFPANQITIPEGGSFQYIFPPTPQFGVEPQDDIFEKARVIVSAIRHGQYHADVTKIKHPLSILNSLRMKGLKPHSHALKQYGALIKHRICGFNTVDKYGESYEIYFIDTPENEKAMDLAEMMLKGEDPHPGVLHEPEIKELLNNDGSFDYSAEFRQKISSEFESKKLFHEMMESIRGIN